MDQAFLDQCRQAVACAERGDSGTAMVKEKVARKHLKEFGPFSDERGAYDWVVGELALALGQSEQAAKTLLEAANHLGRSRQAEVDNADLLVDVYASIGRACLRNGRYDGAVQAMKVSIRRATRVDGANTWDRVLAVTPRLAGALYLAGDPSAPTVLAEGLKRTEANHDSDKVSLYLQQSAMMLESVDQQDEAERYRKIGGADLLSQKLQAARDEKNVRFLTAEDNRELMSEGKLGS